MVKPTVEFIQQLSREVLTNHFKVEFTKIPLPPPVIRDTFDDLGEWQIKLKESFDVKKELALKKIEGLIEERQKSQVFIDGMHSDFAVKF